MCYIFHTKKQQHNKNGHTSVNGDSTYRLCSNFVILGAFSCFQ